MNTRPDKAELLRVAHPRERNTQQTGVNHATTPATATQQPSLKALALQALERNNPRNKPATQAPKTTQQTPFPDASLLRQKLHRIAADEGIDAVHVHELTEADVAACEGLEELTLRDYLRSRYHAHLRETGRRPAHETALAVCEGCGLVWVEPEIYQCPAIPIADGLVRIGSCGWCHVKNRTGMAKPELDQGKTT